MKSFFKSLQNRLTNINQSNKALFHKRLYAQQDMDLDELDFLIKDSSYAIIEKLLASSRSIKICDELDSRNEKSNLASKRLKNILRSHQQIIQESGHNDLFVAWPYVEGKFQNGAITRSPLLLIPINLTLVNHQWSINRVADSPIQFNKNFFLAYAHYNEVVFDEEFLEQNLHELGSDSQDFLNKLYALLKDHQVTLDFNRELFGKRIERFQSINKADVEHIWGQGQLRLSPMAVLGMFPQAQSYLSPDYESLINDDPFEEAEDLFEAKTVQYPTSKDKEAQTFAPYPIDISQETCLKKVKNGHSLVVQGPPGSGKSQLICNLAADFIARGKKVLVVCQKKVALDVVYERLGEKNLQHFATTVHDIKADRKRIYSQIEEQITHVPDYEQQNNQLNTIEDERSFNSVSQQIDSCAEELEEFRLALFDFSEAGTSVKELYLNTDENVFDLAFRDFYAYYKADQRDRFIKNLRVWYPFFSKVMVKKHPWKDRKAFINYTNEDKQVLLRLIDHIPAFQENFRKETEKLLGHAIETSDANWIVEKESLFGELLTLLKPKLNYQYFKHYLDRNDVDEEWLTLKEKQLTDPLKGHGILKGVENKDINRFQDAIRNYLNVRRNPFTAIKWWLFNKDKPWIKRTLISNGLTWKKSEFAILEQKIDNRQNYNHVLSELQECAWLPEAPEKTEVAAIGKWFNLQQTVIQAWQLTKELRAFKAHLEIYGSTYQETEHKIKSILVLSKDAQQERSKWLQYLSETQISNISTDEETRFELSQYLNIEFDTIREWDSTFSTWSHDDQKSLELLIDKVGDQSAEAYCDYFYHSINNHWINHIEKKHPVLAMVSSPKHEQLQKELALSIREKAKIAEKIVTMKAKEMTYADLEFNRLNNRVSYRDLEHQVTKKRRVWPLRKTVHEFEDELFKLIPCWLASPDAVSAIFPMRDLFDLVIFDEASQCFLEEGLPAMLRGKQICVCGDGKQLPPNDLYQVRWDEDSEHPDLNIDSVLDFASRYLENITLTGHYRSKSPELIEFSNQNFYRGKLKLIPDKNDLEQNSTSLEYVHCEGKWEKGCNPTEAAHIAKHLFGQAQQNDTDIGVVTFNQKQQALIQDLTEQLFHENEQEVPSQLFIKNIENVQGDERNTIIFSVGYAPDSSGKFHMNFGLLNQEGGENRLNVAVTRAKSKIVLVTSIYPDQLQVEDTLHDGPKLLKQYLSYVHSYSKEGGIPNTENNTKHSLKSKILNNKNIDLDWVSDYHFADLGIKNSNKLVLTDDNALYQSIHAKGCYGYESILLEHKNWQYSYSFSRNFYSNREEWREKILRFAHQ